MNNRKVKKILIITLLVIIVPIIFNRVKPAVLGMIAAKMRAMPTKVETEHLRNEEIYLTGDATGRVEAKYQVAVVARINGWLQKAYFKEGDYVKKGQVLFLIEPDEYALAVKNAEANVRNRQAALLNAEKNLKRAAELVKGDYVSKSYYDDALAARDTNKAGFDAAVADLARKRLDLSYTRVTSPVDGKIGKILITPGNYVTAQTGTITNIVSIDPAYVAFTMKNEKLSKLREITDSKTQLPDVTVKVKFANDTIYDKTGTLDFVDNMINRDLGTLALRATFPNPEGKLITNDFVRVLITANKKVKVSLIPQEIVLESVNGKYVWIIDENGCAKQVDIEVDGMHDKDWIVTKGLKPEDKVIASSIQSIRQGSKVTEIELTAEEKAEKAKARKQAEEYNMMTKPNEQKNR